MEPDSLLAGERDLHTNDRTIPVREWTHVAVTYDGSSCAVWIEDLCERQGCGHRGLEDKLTKEITGGGYDSIDLGERFRDKGFRGGLVDSFQVFPFQLSPLESLRLYSEDQAKILTEKGFANLSIENQAIVPTTLPSRHHQSRSSLGNCCRKLGVSILRSRIL